MKEIDFEEKIIYISRFMLEKKFPTINYVM